MANFGGHILTRAGQNLLAKLAATGGTLSYSSIKFGDGVLGSTLPTELTALISVKESVEPSRIVQRTADGRWNITGVLDNSKITIGFYLREWGVFARDPNTSAEVLLIYANAGSTAEYIPAYAGGDTTTYIEKEMTAACVVSGGITVNTEISSELYIPQREKGQPNGVVGANGNNKANPNQISSFVKGVPSSRTLSLSDAGQYLVVDQTTNVTITVPSTSSVAFPNDSEIFVHRLGSGEVNFASQSGIILAHIGGEEMPKCIPNRYGTVKLKKITSTIWILENDVPPSHKHDATDLTNVVRSKSIISGVSADYTSYVLPLCSLNNTDKNFESFFEGTVYFKRNNGLNTHSPMLCEVSCEKMYDTDTPRIALRYTPSGSTITLKAVTFMYNGIKYAGLSIKSTSANFTRYEIAGKASDWGIIQAIPYYNNNTSTALNAEISGSIVDVPDACYQDWVFEHGMRISIGANKYIVWHSGNMGKGSALDAGKLSGVDASKYLTLDAEGRTLIPSGADLNTYKITGKYYINSSTDLANILNSPSSPTGGFMDIRFKDGAYGAQIFYGWGQQYQIRYYNGTTWEPWRNLSDGGNADTVDGKHANEFAPASHTHTANQVAAGTLAGMVKANAAAQGTLGDAQVRDIYVTTTDLTAGVTALATGTFAAVYE
ncbi:MAG: pyocin knob domain-containing protein [Candidatus Fimivivens sp.]|nr:pyocin knob domain-containing protein [Candidatus Fimivivens sp.]